mgnify:FL=1
MGAKVELTEAEMQVMGVVWAGEDVTAKQVVDGLGQACGYSSSTSYTLIYRCIKKGAITRQDPGFILKPLVSREEMQDFETRRLADRLFDGSLDNLFAALIDRREISGEAVERLRGMIDDYEKSNPQE